MLHMDQSMSNHVNRRSRLLQNDVADQPFIGPISWVHVDEKKLAEDWPEAFHLDTNRPTDSRLHNILGGDFHFHAADLHQIPQTVPPSGGQNHVRGAGVHPSITPNARVHFRRIVDPHRCPNSSHDHLIYANTFWITFPYTSVSR